MLVKADSCSRAPALTESAVTTETERPEIRALAAHPTLYQAWEDKKVRELLNNNDLSGFIDHPKVRAVLADEQLQKDAEKVDLTKIIEQSLQKPKK